MYGHGTLLILISAALAGCVRTVEKPPIIETRIVEKPVPITCEIQVPTECKEVYAVDRVSIADGPLRINRAFRIELEERSACEVMLRAAIRGCGKK